MPEFKTCANSNQNAIRDAAIRHRDNAIERKCVLPAQQTMECLLMPFDKLAICLRFCGAMQFGKTHRQGNTMMVDLRSKIVLATSSLETFGGGRNMAQDNAEAPLMERPPSYRWMQLFMGIICMVMIANLQYGWTLFVNPITEKYGW